MFYLLKRIDEKQCTVGERVMVLADFVGIKAGTIGKVHEIYEGGVMIEWPAKSEREKHHPLLDGFGREELEYLGFETEKHPKLLN